MAEDKQSEAEAEAAQNQEPDKRTISDEELQRVLAEHKKWLETEGKEGQRADLSNTDLSGKDLHGAHLDEADLHGAHLSRADLHGAVLAEANLHGARLRSAGLQEADLAFADLHGAVLLRASLSGADLIQADLTQAKLGKADLRHAALDNVNLGQTDLTKASLRHSSLIQTTLPSGEILRGDDAKEKPDKAKANTERSKKENIQLLTAWQLGGADLTSASIPDHIKASNQDGLKTVEDVSMNARKVFLALITACAFSLLTLATRGVQASYVVKIPLLGTEVPTYWFVLFTPLVLLFAYIYLHLYLQKLWEALAKLPAVFTDGRALDERIYPWLLNEMVRYYLPRIRRQSDPVEFRLFRWLVPWFSAWWLVPLTLLAFALREVKPYMSSWVQFWAHRQQWGLQVSVFVLSVVLAVEFYRIAVKTLRE